MTVREPPDTLLDNCDLSMYMIEIALHAGTEHPSLLWIIIPSMLTFLAGMLIGNSLSTTDESIVSRLRHLRD